MPPQKPKKPSYSKTRSSISKPLGDKSREAAHAKTSSKKPKRRNESEKEADRELMESLRVGGGAEGLIPGMVGTA